MPGRVRLRVPAIRPEPSVAGALQRALEQRHDVTDLRVNRTCASIVVRHDPAATSAPVLREFVAEQDSATLLASHGDEPPEAPRFDRSGLEFALSSAAVATGFFFQPWTVPLVPLMLAPSVQSMFARAYDALTRRKTLNVDVLDSAATSLMIGQGQLFSAAFMVWLVDLGDYIRYRTMERSKRAIGEMLELEEQQAWVVRNGTKERVPIEALEEGDEIVVYTGGRIPADGIVTRGKAAVDEQALTGESQPVEKAEGDTVYAATAVRDGKIYITAERMGTDTEAAQIVRLIQEAPGSDTRMQDAAEKRADRLVPVSLGGAGALLLLTGDASRAASFLIIDYGTGIRVAAPTTVLASMTKAARQGILIKNGRALETLPQVDAVVFDKTGTLTTGDQQVERVFGYGVGTSEVLRLAAGAEQRLSHPIAKAVVQEATARGLEVPDRPASDYEVGKGVVATVEGKTMHVGNRSLLDSVGIEVPEAAKEDVRSIEQEAASPLFVAMQGEVIGLISLTDPIRGEAPAVLQALRERGIDTMVMLTGDRGLVARRVADRLGIDTVVAEVMPDEKLDAVEQLQDEGHTVAVVGDGVNDSPALSRADVGIAVNGGTDVAQEASDVVLLRGNLEMIPAAIDCAREGIDLIEQNWRLIAVPNTAALGLTALGLIGPVTATVISNGAAIVAGGNALRPLFDREPSPVLEPPGAPDARPSDVVRLERPPDSEVGDEQVTARAPTTPGGDATAP
ncbi:MAG: heavy metal translocating P-type ATPase [Salinibacter sp.]